MRSASEVFYLDAVNGASLCALTATGAKRIINGGKVVDYLDRAVRAGLLTLHTADTAVRAVFAYQSALIVIGAFDYDASGIIDYVND